MSSGTKEGVVKYRAHHTPDDVAAYLRKCPPALRDAALSALERFPELDAARTALHDAGLIGVYPSGIGYGNISLRLADALFLISGSGTGAHRTLGMRGYSLVHAFDPSANTVSSCGPVRASSESMTHGAIYRAAPAARCVIHVHNRALFSSLLAQDWPHTPESAAYGTPALSLAVARLAAELPPAEGVFVTAGHEEGLIAYGSTIASALDAILSLQHGTRNGT